MRLPRATRQHRLFCHITQTWRGTPLTSRLAVVDLIAATTTTTGLRVHCELDTRAHPKGIKVTDPEMAALNIEGNKFHPDWNYTIAPSPSSRIRPSERPFLTIRRRVSI